MYRNRVAATGGRALAALLCAFVSSGWAPPPPHPFRLSVADVGVGDATLDVRIRFFWDDLQFAVMEHTSDMAFELAESAQVDATVERYINDMLVVEAGGAVIAGTVLERGIQDARNPDEVMWWYRLEYPLDASVDRVRMRNRVLFNMFEDQRNLVHLKTRRGRERTYYFGLDEDSVTLRLN